MSGRRRAGRGGLRRSQGSGGGEVGADVVVVQGAVGVQRDLGAEQGGGGALELEHVERVAAIGDVAAELSGRGEGQVGDAVARGQADELGAWVRPAAPWRAAGAAARREADSSCQRKGRCCPLARRWRGTATAGCRWLIVVLDGRNSPGAVVSPDTG
jgi:hypothetical protein